MADKDHVPPALAHIVGKCHYAVRTGIDRIAKIGIATATSVPVLAKMRGRAEAKTPRFVISGRIWFSDRKIKSVCELDLRTRMGLRSENQENRT